MSKEFMIGTTYIYLGASKNHFGLGFTVNRWSFSADFGPLWIGIEW